MSLFAGNEEINQWLSEHPVVLGLGASAIGFVLLAIGISAIITGRAATKRGPDLEGKNALAMGIVWIVFGAAALLFGLFKIVSGLL